MRGALRYVTSTRAISAKGEREEDSGRLEGFDDVSFSLFFLSGRTDGINRRWSINCSGC